MQDVQAENFSLIEVLLDKGVVEKRVERSDKPWQVMQHSRKVIVDMTIIRYNDNNKVVMVLSVIRCRSNDNYRVIMVLTMIK